MAHIYITHGDADAVAAMELTKSLRVAGHQTLAKPWTIDLGDSVVKEVDAGIALPRSLVLCYSNREVPAFVTDQWSSALLTQLAELNISIYSALLSQPPPPAALAKIEAVDLSTNDRGGMTELLRLVA